MIRTSSFLELILLAAATSACGSDLVTPDEIAGDYALVRVDDARLPVVVAETETRTEEIVGGSLALFAFAEYTMSIDFRITLITQSGLVVTDSTFIDVGPFTINDDLIVMRSTRPGVTRYGTLDGSSVIVGYAREGPNLLLTYRR
jgi:hypothetical protein